MLNTPPHHVVRETGRESVKETGRAVHDTQYQDGKWMLSKELEKKREGEKEEADERH